MKIGEFLISINAITEDQCREVLNIQNQEPERLFGEIAIELGYIDDAAVDQYLSQQKPT